MVSQLKDEIEFIEKEIDRIGEIKNQVKQKVFDLNHNYSLLREEYRMLKENSKFQQLSIQKYTNKIQELQKYQQFNLDQREKNKQEQAMILAQLQPSQYVDLLLQNVLKLANKLDEKESALKELINEERIKYVMVKYQDREVKVRNTEQKFTFQQLHSESCHFFNIRQEDCILKDQNGQFWPPDAEVRNAQILEFQIQKKMKKILEIKKEQDFFQEQLIDQQQQYSKNERIQSMLIKRNLAAKQIEQKVKRELQDFSSDEDENLIDSRPKKSVNFLIILKTLITCFFYILIVAIIVANKNPFYLFYNNDVFRDRFEKTSFSDNELSLVQNQVMNFNQLYAWINQIVIPTIFEFQYSDTKLFVSDYNQVLGAIRVMSHRVRSSCQFIDLSKRIKTPLQNNEQQCFGPYSENYQETAPYQEFLKFKGICDFSNFTQEKLNERKFFKEINETFVQEGADIKLTINEANEKCYNLRIFNFTKNIPNQQSYQGLLQNYDPSAYIADLDANQTSAIRFFKNLQKQKFFDEQTRTFFILLNMYNVNFDQFIQVRVGFEIDSSGFFQVSNRYNTMKFNFERGWQFMFSSLRNFLTKLQDVFILLYTFIVLIPSNYKRAIKQRYNYLLRFNNIAQLMLILFILGTLLMEIYSDIQISKIELNFIASRIYLSLAPAMYSQWLVHILQVCQLFSMMLNLISIFKVGKLQLLFLTLKQAALTLFSFGIIFFIILFSFGIAACRFYGSHISIFRNYQVSILTLLQLISGEVKILDEMLNVSWSMTIIFFLLFLLICYFVLLNIFSSILIETYSANVIALNLLYSKEQTYSKKFIKRLKHEYSYFFHILKRKMRNLKKQILLRKEPKQDIDKYLQRQKFFKQQNQGIKYDFYNQQLQSFKQRQQQRQDDINNQTLKLNSKFPQKTQFNQINYGIQKSIKNQKAIKNKQ